MVGTGRLTAPLFTLVAATFAAGVLAAPARAAVPPLDTPYVDAACACAYWLPAQPYDVRKQRDTTSRGTPDTEMHVDAVSPDKTLNINLVYWRTPNGESEDENQTVANNVRALAGHGYRFAGQRSGTLHGGPALVADFVAEQSGALYPNIQLTVFTVGDRVVVVQIAADSKADVDTAADEFNGSFQLG